MGVAEAEIGLPLRVSIGYDHLSPPAAPWCSGLTCHPVKVEIGGSNPLGVAITRYFTITRQLGGFFVAPARDCQKSSRESH